MAKDTPEEDLLYFNGVNGATGDYGLPPMTGEELSRFLQGEAPPENLSELRFRHDQKDQRHFGVKEGVDPKKLDQAGWGVVFAPDADPAVREALAPLLALRQEQAGERFKVYEKADGYRPGEPKAKFLARHGAGPGPADPETAVPYYLLLVGSPEAIPYRFQSQLDVQYAVGRIHFDAPEDYARYAESVVVAEESNSRAGIWAPPSRRARLALVASSFRKDQDKATGLSSQHLVSPLCEYLRARRSDWEVSSFATPKKLTCRGSRKFSASHGMEFPNGDSRQLPHQGALLCQDWPGPRAWRGQGPIPQDCYFAGDDLASDAHLLGLIGFYFACYGAGTPHRDEFARQAFKGRAEIAPHAFLAGLPTKMLSHPRGGALAVVGTPHRPWGPYRPWSSRYTNTRPLLLRRSRRRSASHHHDAQV